MVTRDLKAFDTDLFIRGDGVTGRNITFGRQDLAEDTVIFDIPEHKFSLDSKRIDVQVGTVTDLATLDTSNLNTRLVYVSGLSTAMDGLGGWYYYRSTGRPAADGFKFVDGAGADDYFERIQPNDKLTLATGEATVVDGDKLGQIDFQAPKESDGGDSILVGASIWAEADATFSATVNNTELVFATAESEVAVEKMRLTSDGKLGIGISTPDKLLHVHKASAGAIAADVNSILVMENSGQGNLEFLTPSTTGTHGIIWSDGTGAGYISYTHVNNEMAFWTNGLASHDLVIKSDGKVGIGIDAPPHQLVVTKRGTNDGGTTKLRVMNPATAVSSFVDVIAGNGDAQTPYLSIETRENVSPWNQIERLRVDYNGDIGVNLSGPVGKLHVKQGSTTRAIPVLTLEQLDIDDQFMNFIGTSAADGTRSISSDTTEDSTKFGAIAVEINGVKKWIRIYDNES